MRRDSWNRFRVGVSAAGLLGLALLALGAGAGAHQGDPGDLSLIHACVATRDGNVRIVGATGTCNANKETAAHWAAVPSGRFIDLGLTVFDTQTKLLWEKKVTGGACLHCVDDTYTWCQATGGAGDNCAVSPPSWIAQVNAEAFAGFADWRVPTGGADGGELATILLAPFSCGTSPCIDPIFGPTAASRYWSSTENGVSSAWLVDFANGFVTPVFKDGGFRVRAVRGGP